MPTRMIREEILDSERYWSASDSAKVLFYHLMLLADDLGCVSLAPAFLRRRAFDGRPSQAEVDRLLCELADADLIRVYEANGARYAFVPRFRQRLQRRTLKHPPPPAQLYADDPGACATFAQILEVAPIQNKHLAENSTAGQQLPTAGQHPKGREGKRSEVLPPVSIDTGGVGSARADADPMPPDLDDRWWDQQPAEQLDEAQLQAHLATIPPPVLPAKTGRQRVAAPPLLACPVERIVELYHATLPTLPRVMVLTDARRGHVRARWREMAQLHRWDDEQAGLDFFGAYFRYVAESKFLTGRVPGRDGRPPFTANLDWLMTPGHWANVVEGKYHR